MKTSAIILAKKTNVTWGSWTDEKPKRSDFPMSRKRGGVFPVSRSWRWNTISFDALNNKFVIFVAYHKKLPEFQAVLAQLESKDTKTIVRYEYHGNHPVVGWHVHALCTNTPEDGWGVTKPLGQQRIPATHRPHRRSDFCCGAEAMTDTLAFQKAAERFGVPFAKDLLGGLVLS